jgi:glucosylceramidase
MRLKSSLSGACFFVLIAVPLFAQTAYLRTTTDANRWVNGGSIQSATWANPGSYIEIFPNTEYQTVMGWGGTIQEKQWEAMKVLSAAGKDSIMRELFDTSGCNISFLRCPIGCCDFDLNENPISLNDSAGDYDMTAFSLHRDSTRKIPLIKMAQAINPNIRFWGCPWSPPRWMHDNGTFDKGNMKSDAQTLSAYALYLEKFIQGYKEAGINIEWVTCQNEPNITDGGYPKCGWTNALELNFYKNYLIPQFKKDNINAKIFLGVYCCGEYADWVTYFMNDATVGPYIGWTSHSYQSPDWGLKATTDYPSVPFMESEAPFGPWPDVGPQNWDRGRDAFNNVADFMNNRTSVYTMWNMVNDETAKSGFDWAQMVMIQVNKTTKQVTYNSHFYAYKHFANYVKAGAKAIKYTITGTAPNKTVAFKNPNGDYVLVFSNTSSGAMPITIKSGNVMWKASLPANSFSTVRVASGTPVQEKKVLSTTSLHLDNAGITNSTLYFTLSKSTEVQELNITLSDLQGRTVWTGHRGGANLDKQQVFPIQSKQGGLQSGTYMMSVRIKNGAGAITTLENKVKVVN